MTMVKFEELENKIRQSRGNYSFINDGQGKKKYTILSEELKNSLRDVIHETAQKGEWQINHTVGEGIIRYRKKQDSIFGSYWKNLKDDADEFVMLSENQTSDEKKEFEKTKSRMAETRERMARRKQHSSQGGESQQPRSGEGSYISYSGDENVFKEALEILDRKKQEENASQSSQNQQQAQIRQSDNSNFFLTFWNQQGKKS